MIYLNKTYLIIHTIIIINILIIHICIFVIILYRLIANRYKPTYSYNYNNIQYSYKSNYLCDIIFKKIQILPIIS